jgi:hypothetical protein
MLSLQDCIALCGLTEEEVLAIGHHENLPEITAAGLGSYLVRTPEGELCIKAMIRDDIAAALAAGNARRALTLKLVLRDFIGQHPACNERLRRELHLPDRRLT